MGSGTAAFRPAGKLGDYKCDLPVWTYHAILKDIKQKHPKRSPDHLKKGLAYFLQKILVA